MKTKVVSLPEVREYFKELIHILYEKEYFSYEDSAIEYVESLFEDIKTTLPQRLKKNGSCIFFPIWKRYVLFIFQKE